MILLSVKGNESYFDSDFVLSSTSTLDPVNWLPTEEQNIQSATEQTITDVSSNNAVIEIKDEDSELTRKLCPVSQQEGPLQCESDSARQVENPWKEWNPSVLKTKKHPVLSKPKQKKPFDTLTEEKIEIARLQKKLITEELEQKFIQRKILEKELEHKDIIDDLEIQQHLLKIKLLKKGIRGK